MTNASDRPRKALGKGLSALLPSRPPTAAAPSPASDRNPTKLPLEVIQPNPVQPRTVFQPERLEELAASIRVSGVLQPLVVRRVDRNFQIVAGERRWRAAKLAGLREIPVVVQDVADAAMLELALIENIQREDLNPIEAAEAFARLGKELGLSQEQLGQRTGKDRATIANLIRLLKLPREVQQLVAEHRLSMGHARAILGVPDPDQQIELANKATAHGLSVRQVEAQVKELTSARTGGDGKRQAAMDPNVRAAMEELQRILGTRVRIVQLSDQRGRIEIDYFSPEELDRVYQQIAGGE